MTKLAIFSTEQDAIDYSNKLHQYLSANRPGYNAVKWCDPEQSADGLTWIVKEPPEQNEDLWDIPINTATELNKATGQTEDLPEFGIQCVKDKYYLYKGDVLKCRQTHNRTIYEPKDTPALFSFFRDNSDQLEWIAGEQVEVGWMRIYNGTKYEVIQAHQTQEDWTPIATLNVLWKVYVDPLAGNEWQIGVAYKVNDIVTYQGSTYKCLQAHTSQTGWTPIAVPALWQLQ